MLLANNQDKTKENHHDDVYELNKNNEKVTRHKKKKIRAIKSKFSENLIQQTPKKRKS